MNRIAPTLRPDWVSDGMYPFESGFFAAGSGHRMHYVDEGEGEPIVFVHGNPAWSFEFRHAIRELRSEFRCVAPDHIGFGLSSRSSRPEDHHPESHAHRFAALLDHLDLRDITLFMNDWGGPIGLDFARRHPERIRRLVIAKHVVLAGRRRHPLQGVQLPDVELGRPVSDPASQHVREHGDAESGGGSKHSDAGDHGALPQRAAVACRARCQRGISGLHRGRGRLAALDLGRPGGVLGQAGTPSLGPEGHCVPKEGTRTVEIRAA